MTGWIARTLVTTAIVAAAPSWATPPDSISIEDSPFAASSTAIFLIRETRDNLGMYQAERIERFLVMVDPETGLETIWPIFRAQRITEYGEAPEDDVEIVTILDEDTWASPYKIIIGWNALPFARENVDMIGDLSAPEPDGDMLTMAFPEGLSFSYRPADMQARVKQVTTDMGELVEDVPRMGTVTTRQLYRDRPIDPVTCSYTPDPHLTGSPKRSFLLMRVTCDDGDGLALSSILVPIAANPPKP